MLTISMHGDVLHVVETQHSFVCTKHIYWYYDVKQWLRSRKGTEGDTPTEPMTQAEIDWVTKNYLPKVGL